MAIYRVTFVEGFGADVLISDARSIDTLAATLTASSYLTSSRVSIALDMDWGPGTPPNTTETIEQLGPVALFADGILHITEVQLRS